MSNLQSPAVASEGVFTTPLLQANMDCSHPSSPKCQIIFGPGTNKDTAPKADILDNEVASVFTLWALLVLFPNCKFLYIKRSSSWLSA